MADEMSCRVLVQGGAWTVPPDQRPASWRAMAARDPWAEDASAVVVAPAPVPVESPDKVSILDEIVEKQQTTNGIETVTLCSCGKQLNHKYMCSARSRKAVATRARYEARSVELRAHIADLRLDEWAMEMGGEKDGPRIALAAKVLFLGLWTRDPGELARALSRTAGFIREMTSRAVAQGLWCEDGSVVLCNIDDEPDVANIEMLLNVMALTGDVVRCLDGMYRA